MKKPLFICVVLIMIIASAASLPFVLNAGFGQPPQGEQLTEVEASPQYRDGKFHNTLPTPGYNGDKNMLVATWDFLTKKTENARPAQPLPLVKTDLASLPLEEVARPLLVVPAARGQTHPDRPGARQLCRAVLVSE